MEYLIVIFSEPRDVVINEVNSGQKTNTVIEVETGRHKIALSGPADYTPAAQELTLNDTSALDPKEVFFEKT